MDIGRRKSYDLKQMEKNYNWNTLTLIQVISWCFLFLFLSYQFDLAKVNALYIFPFAFPIQASYPIQALPLPSAWCHLPDEAQVPQEGNMTSCLSWPSSQTGVLTRNYCSLSTLVAAFASLKSQDCSPFTASVSNTAPQTQRPKLV